jgi:hypothetical protein
VRRNLLLCLLGTDVERTVITTSEGRFTADITGPKDGPLPHGPRRRDGA